MCYFSLLLGLLFLENPCSALEGNAPFVNLHCGIREGTKSKPFFNQVFPTPSPLVGVPGKKRDPFFCVSSSPVSAPLHGASWVEAA